MKLVFVLCALGLAQPQNLAENREDLIRSTDDATFVLAAPGTLLAGAPNRLCLSRVAQGTEGVARLQLDLVTDDDQQSLVFRLRKNFSPGNGGCFDVSVPKNAHTDVNIHLRLQFEALPSYEVARTLRGLRVLHNTNLVTIQTDRPVYRRGDNLRFRVLGLQPDLLPVHAPIHRIWLELPPGAWGGRVRAAQWSRVRTQMGLAQLEYQLDDYAPKGEWSIRVEDESGAESSAHTFTVADYTLPTFYISVEYPARLLTTSTRVTWTVCARHVWGEGVRGTLTMVMHGDGDSTTISQSARLFGQPCYNHTLDVRRLGVGSGKDGPGIIVADIAFQDENTRLWKNTSVISKVVEDKIHIEFVNKNKMFVSPGLPYKIKMKVTDWDDQPLVDVPVKVCRTASEGNSEENDVETSVPPEPCDNVYTDGKGYAQAAFNVPGELSTLYYRVQATVRSITANLTLSVRTGTIHAALGALGNGLRHHVPLLVSYPPYVAIRAPTVHLLLVTRGGTIHRWSATTQCPQPSTGSLHPRQTVPPGSFCQNSGSTRNLLRLALPARVSHQMCPNSHMLVYFHHDGELVFAAKHFKVSECFYNKVMASWVPSTVAPGDSTRLVVKSLGPALCATAASDLALRHLHPSSAVPLHNHLVEKLRTFSERRKNITMREVPTRSCLAENGLSDSAIQNYEHVFTSFGASGLRIISDLVPDLDCPNDQPEPLERPSKQKERSYFPETWLWTLQLLPANGSLTLDVVAPDSVTQYETTVTCVSRSGVSMAPMTILKVFQPFFVELDTPRSLRKGEQTQFFYKIFNYINTSIAVTIDIETDPDSGISVLGAQGSTPGSHTICVGVSDVYSVRLVVSGTSVATWKLGVRAAVLPQMQKFCGSDDGGVFPSDKIMKTITVEPEGDPIEKHHSTMLCTEDDRFTREVEWPWDVAERTVHGTELWKIWIIGDLIGPIDLNADKLLTLPLGCGEQNMARLAHNLMALRHMERAHTLTQELREKALGNVMSGYARQITYTHPKGGFSAFGPADDLPSSWLTAFCLRYLSMARRKLSMEGHGHALAAAEDWLVGLQLENGCFQSVGQVFHREFKGGLDSETSNIALTAYILISLMESGAVLRPKVIHSTSFCLEALHKSPKAVKNLYTLALVAYAQTRLDKYEMENRLKNGINVKKKSSSGTLNNEIERNNKDKDREDEEIEATDGLPSTHAVGLLRQAAIRRNEMVWWETDSLSTSIEATSYAILALLESHDLRRHEGLKLEEQVELQDAGAAVKWLSIHRNSAGGFMATQDTLVALEAISAWSEVTAHSAPDLQVTVNGPGIVQVVQVGPESRYDLHTFAAGAGTVRVKAQGRGCVLVQATQHYNSLDAAPASISPFSLHASVKTEGVFDCQYNASLCQCATILEVCVSWVSRDFPEMALLEIDLPTGYRPDKTLLYKLLDKDNVLLRRLEETKNKVIMYLATRGTYRRFSPRQCVTVYLVGPQSRTAPSVVQVYDYYHREVNASKSYTIPENCPGPIAHEEPSRLSSNNLYRSLDETDDLEDETEYRQNSDEIYPYNPVSSRESAEHDTVNNTNENEEDTTMASTTQKIIDENVKYDEIETEARREETLTMHVEDKNVTDSPVQNSIVEDALGSTSETEILLSRPAESESAKSTASLIFNDTKTSHSKVQVAKESLKEHSNVQNSTTKDVMFENFHTIDSDMDLDVPEGMEGPIPSIVAPPSDFVWNGPVGTTEALLAKLPAACEDRFANWTDVAHDMEAAENARTLPCHS